jgi:hypothetical protein
MTFQHTYLRSSWYSNFGHSETFYSKDNNSIICIIVITLILSLAAIYAWSFIFLERLHRSNVYSRLLRRRQAARTSARCNSIIFTTTRHSVITFTGTNIMTHSSCNPVIDTSLLLFQLLLWCRDGRFDAITSILVSCNPTTYTGQDDIQPTLPPSQSTRSVAPILSISPAWSPLWPFASIVVLALQSPVYSVPQFFTRCHSHGSSSISSRVILGRYAFVSPILVVSCRLPFLSAGKPALAHCRRTRLVSHCPSKYNPHGLSPTLSRVILDTRAFVSTILVVFCHLPLLSDRKPTLARCRHTSSVRRYSSCSHLYYSSSTPTRVITSIISATLSILVSSLSSAITLEQKTHPGSPLAHNLGPSILFALFSVLFKSSTNKSHHQYQLCYFDYFGKSLVICHHLGPEKPSWLAMGTHPRSIDSLRDISCSIQIQHQHESSSGSALITLTTLVSSLSSAITFGQKNHPGLLSVHLLGLPFFVAGPSVLLMLSTITSHHGHLCFTFDRFGGPLSSAFCSE